MVADAVSGYHPGKANVVADVLCRKSFYSAVLFTTQEQLINDFGKLEIDVTSKDVKSLLVNSHHLISKINQAQLLDPTLKIIVGDTRVNN